MSLNRIDDPQRRMQNARFKKSPTFGQLVAQV